MKTSVAVIALALAAAMPAVAAQPVPYLPVPKNAAVILNSGSTNTEGYRIVLTSSGQAEYVEGSTRSKVSVPSALTDKFFADLQRAMPLSHLRILACMKSASFGTETYVWWRGQRSPDISCPGDQTAMALNGDVTSITGALHVSNAAGGHTIPMLPNEPRWPMPVSSPSPSPMSVRYTARAL